jgi:alkanesulfonate monooxygenase SsuD/methylene tetrahydromethanopterin reductase-like flavin-dependent oxidoreductase (luciferase family)
MTTTTTESKNFGMMFGINLNPYAKRIESSFEMAKLAENLGFDIIGIQDQQYSPDFLDTWTLLTALALTTDRIRFMTTVITLPLHPPAELAKQAATLDNLTHGRFELGIGGGGYVPAIQSYGGSVRSPAESVEALEEAIAIIRKLWDWEGEGNPITYHGKFYNLDGAIPGPRPYHKIGIWVGNTGKRKMLSLTARLSDGWIAPFQSYLLTGQVRQAQRQIDDFAASVGRSPNSIPRLRLVSGVIDSEGRFSKSLHGQGQAVIGSPDDWVNELLYYKTELGLDSFIFWLLSKGVEQVGF